MPAPLTDTHCHLQLEQFQEDLPEVVEAARSAGVERILTLGIDAESSRHGVQIAGQFPEVFAAVGIHPTDVKEDWQMQSEQIREMAQNHPKVVAIGEIGLDLYWKDVPLPRQLPVLEAMLQLAEDLSLPVVIHNREAQEEMQEFFRAHGIRSLRGVMHSFAGSIADAEFYLERGMYISFTGVITFKNFKQQEVVRYIPLNRLLLETDAPFLAPVPFRGKRNQPAYVRYIAEKHAELRGISEEEVRQVTSANARELFGW